MNLQKDDENTEGVSSKTTSKRIEPIRSRFLFCKLLTIKALRVFLLNTFY
jgi:hypothetical protein